MAPRGKASSRVLVIFPGALGDLICFAPTLSAIMRQNREAQTELMARGELAHFAVGGLGVARAHSIDRHEVALLFRDSASESPASEDLRRARALFGAFARIYSFFSADNPRFRQALSEASWPAIVTFHRFRPESAGHIVAAYLEEIGAGSAAPQVRLDFPARDLEAATRALSGLAEPGNFVAILPGSGSPAKNWPIGKFRALADRIAETTPALFILGPAETDIADRLGANVIASNNPPAGSLPVNGSPADSSDNGKPARRHPVLQDLSLGVVAAVARLASAFVGVDSGVSHLAAAAGTRGVVLFGATDPARWRPLGRVTIIRREPINAIEMEEVLAALRALKSPRDPQKRR